MDATRQPIGKPNRPRAGVDGAVAFCCLALGLGLGVLALLERMGVAVVVIRSLLLCGVLGGLCAIAVLQRTMRVSRFYTGGRDVPASYAALALVGLIAALAMPLLTAPAAALPRATLAAGLLLGGVCAGLLTGPLLRKTGAFSIPDLVAVRFPNLPLRLAVVGIAAVSAGLVGLAAFEAALRPLLAVADLGRPLGAAVLAILVMLLIVPGGLAGAIWTAVAGAVLVFAGLALPLALSIGATGAPDAGAAQSFFLWDAMPRRLATLDPAVGAALTLGVGVLAPLLGPAVACVSTGASQRAGRRAVVLGCGLIALAAALVGHGVRDAGLVPPTLAYAAEVGIELALAAAALQALAATMGHDVVHRMRDTTALTSRRLAITRAFAIGVVACIGLRVAAGPADPLPLIGLAIWLSAATLAPLLMLALWPRAGSRDAGVALITACGAALAAVAAGVDASGATQLAVSALIACATGLAAGLVTSLARRGGEPAGAAFVRSILRDPAEFPQLDRGA